jgi:hypothetical protein
VDGKSAAAAAEAAKVYRDRQALLLAEAARARKIHAMKQDEVAALRGSGIDEELLRAAHVV